MNNSSPTVAAIGEVMVEFAPELSSGQGGASYKPGFAGDTFNTAVSLSRLGISTAYATLLGDDRFSDQILGLMTDENIDTNLVWRLPDRRPGLYVISNDASGERSFDYWRSDSPARQLWTHPESTSCFEENLHQYDCIYLSGITLAIMEPQARKRLRDFLTQFRRQGGKVCFDSNYRARLWKDAEVARETVSEFFSITDIALLTIEDEQQLWGKSSAQEIIRYHDSRQVPEIVIKQGSKPVLAYTAGKTGEYPVPPVESVVDTTGAGDAFNAGYLACRLRGGSAANAAAQGSRAAAAVIQQRGAIVPRAYFLETIAGEDY